MDINYLIGRDRDMFVEDVAKHETDIRSAFQGARVLILGGAGSIGKEITEQIFSRNPRALHVVDLSENNLVELVRQLRSSMGYIDGETRFLPLDMGSAEFDAFADSQNPYDYVLNLAAMKHVRSEKDPYSLMRMIKTNVLDTTKTLKWAQKWESQKYFAVSTDKAKNPANLMGATKRIMEQAIFASDNGPAVSTARFANVAFSDGSLLHGFRQRLALRQPLSAPRDIRRYFVTGKESGLLCLTSLILGKNREIIFPKLDPQKALETFSNIAVRFLEVHGYEVVETENEEEARRLAEVLIPEKKWPCYFFDSDTTGEKPAEEFYAEDDNVNLSRFEDMGVIQVGTSSETVKKRTELFLQKANAFRSKGLWTQEKLIDLISESCPELNHIVTGRSLDDKM